MARQLDDLDELAVRAGAAEREAVRGELLPIDVIELVAVAMPLHDGWLAIRLAGERAFSECRRLSAQPHRAAFVCDVPLLVQKADDRMGSVFVELRGMSASKAND